MPTITELKKKKAALLDDAKALQRAAEIQSRDLSDAEFATVEKNLTEAKDLDGQIQAVERRAGVLAELSAQHGALDQKPVAKVGAAAGHVAVKARFEDDPKKGFATEREFYMAVMRAGMGGRVPENLEYLRAKPTQTEIRAAAGSDEQSTFNDAYGGFLVPIGFSPSLLETRPMEDPIGSRVRMIPMQSPILEVPSRVDKNHASSVSGGLRVYRRAEADTVNSSRMEMERIKLEATGLMGLSYTTEELLRDSPMTVAALLAAGFRDEFASKKNGERIRGTGAGQYLGVLNAPCLVTVSKEVGQGADTFLGENILKMRKRCWNYSAGIWTANHDTYDQLAQIHIAGTNGDVFLFAPSTGDDVPDRLLGRPIYFSEDCSTLGDKGDLILGVWDEYLEAVYEALESAESIHVRFVNHERAFKFTERNAAAPWWKTAMTPKNSTSTLSPFVTLEAR